MDSVSAALDCRGLLFLSSFLCGSAGRVPASRFSFQCTLLHAMAAVSFSCTMHLPGSVCVPRFLVALPGWLVSFRIVHCLSPMRSTTYVHKCVARASTFPCLCPPPLIHIALHDPHVPNHIPQSQ